MPHAKHQTLIWIGLALMVATVAVIATSLPYDESHGWWIFSHTEHIVPFPYLIATAWMIALIYMAFFVRWYAKQQAERSDCDQADCEQSACDQTDWQLIGKTVLGGGLISIILTLTIGQQFTHFNPAFAGPVEELCKFAAVWLLCSRHITNMQSGIFYAVLCAIGFACLENIAYFIHYESVLLIRSDPAHAVFSSFWGAAYGACKAKQLPWRLLWLKWMPIGILFHAAFDSVLMLLLYPLSVWIAVRFIINHKPYFEFILAQRTLQEFLWRKQPPSD
jgi:RsiW-degrading membrane proteinase PrsW (M82 family)